MDWNYFWDETFFGALLFKFLFLIALFLVARVVAIVLWYVIPNGRLKRALFSKTKEEVDGHKEISRP